MRLNPWAGTRAGSSTTTARGPPRPHSRRTGRSPTGAPGRPARSPWPARCPPRPPPPYRQRPSLGAPKLQAAGHPMPVGVRAAGARCSSTHTASSPTATAAAGRTAPRPGHRQPGGNRGSIDPHRAHGRPGPCGVAFWEVARLQASHHDQGHQHQHHASDHQPPVASCCVHADSRSRMQPSEIVHLARPSRLGIRSRLDRCGGRAAQPVHSPGPCGPHGRPHLPDLRKERFARLIHAARPRFGGPVVHAACGGNLKPALVAMQGGTAGSRPSVHRVGASLLVGAGCVLRCVAGPRWPQPLLSAVAAAATATSGSAASSPRPRPAARRSTPPGRPRPAADR